MENTFQKKFKEAVTFPDKKEVVRREKVDLLAFIKQYTRDNIYDKLSVKELSKIKELIELCPEDHRKLFLLFGINSLIKNNKDLEIEGEKIIELIKEFPEGVVCAFLESGINPLIENNKDLEKEGKKIIELMWLCPKDDRYAFLKYGIKPLIENNKDLEKEGKKIIELIKEFPEGVVCAFLESGINPLIENNKDLEKEGKKIIELMWLCPKDDRYAFLKYGIRPLIENNKDLEKEGKRIIKLIKLCPEKDRYYFLEYGINDLIENNKNLGKEGKRIIKLMGLIELIKECHPEQKQKWYYLLKYFLEYGIRPLIKNNKDLEIEGRKIIELIKLCPEDDIMFILEHWIKALIKNSRDREIPWDRSMKLMKSSMYVNNIIESLISNERDVLKEGEKIIELLRLCQGGGNLFDLWQYGIRDLIRYNENKEIPWDLIIKYLPYFIKHKAINIMNIENIEKLVLELEELSKDQKEFNFKEILDHLEKKIFKRLQRRNNKESGFYRPKNIEKKMKKNLVIYIRQGEGEVEGIKTSAIVKLLNDYIKSNRSPVFSKLTVTSFWEDKYPHYIHELGITKKQYIYKRGEDFKKIIADPNSNTIFLTHSNVREVQDAGQIPIISQSVLQNPTKYNGTKEKDYIPLQIFMNQNDYNSPRNHKYFAKKDRSISLERTLIAMMFSLIHLENRLLEKEKESKV